MNFNISVWGNARMCFVARLASWIIDGQSLFRQGESPAWGKRFCKLSD
jgi:hypothetical protein